MRFLLGTLLTATFAFIAGMFLPWWSIALVSFFVALLVQQRLGTGFLSGFTGIFISWAVVAAWLNSSNHNILAPKVAQLLRFGNSSLLLILVTAFIGGVVGGFAALAGSAARPVRKVMR